MDDHDTPRTRSRIVVGIDGSESSTLALQWAARLAPSLDASIEAVICWQFVYATALGASAQWSPGIDAEKALEASVNSAFGDDVPDGLRQSAREGHPSEVLIDASAGAALLIVGSRGRGGFAALLWGSVSSACAEHAHCPVLLVRDNPAPSPA